MIDVIRDFNTPTNDIGEITVYLTNKKQIQVTILNVHEHGYYDFGQAWMYIKNPHNIDIYDAFLTILNKITPQTFEKLSKKYVTIHLRTFVNYFARVN